MTTERRQFPPRLGDRWPRHEPEPRPALPRSARTRAAWCYAVPFLPALVELIRDRPDYAYVRAHAARALLFYCLLAVVQTSLLLWLTVVGSDVTSGWQVVVAGLLFYGAVVATGIGALYWWLRAIGRSLAGHPVTPVGLGWLALRLERRLAPHATSGGARGENGTV
jgi:uncharacterized membrane protein